MYQKIGLKLTLPVSLMHKLHVRAVVSFQHEKHDGVRSSGPSPGLYELPGGCRQAEAHNEGAVADV